MKINITIAIPAHNNAKTIRESIESALAQDYPNKEIVVVDDASTDNTAEIAKSFKDVKVLVNDENLGIGVNLAYCMTIAKGKFIVYLCADDVFTNDKVVSDIVAIFQSNPKIGIINRYYYQFLDGHPGAVMEVRENNLLLSAINPSGMAFRTMQVWGANRIFIELPLIVCQFLKEFDWTTLEYDTVAVRLCPGVNTGTKSTYYNESPIKIITDFFGKNFRYYPLFVQLKNRAPDILWREICTAVKINRDILFDLSFWFHAGVALIVPGSMLRPMSDFYRHRINRHFCSIKQRPGGEIG